MTGVQTCALPIYAFVKARYVCDGVVTTVSATHGHEQLQHCSETTRQIVAADRLLITKCDLAGTQAVEALHASLSRLNAHAAQTLVRRGQAPLDVLVGNGLYGRLHLQNVSLPNWMGTPNIPLVADLDLTPVSHDNDQDHSSVQRLRPLPLTQHHTDETHSFVVRFTREVPWFGFSLVMGHILRKYGKHLLRVKGLMLAADDPRPQIGRASCRERVS